MQGTLNSWYSAVQSIVLGMFGLQIVPGISFGAFLLAVAIFCVIIDYLFRKVVN